MMKGELHEPREGQRPARADLVVEEAEELGVPGGGFRHDARL
jgi:hypothetical protein